MNKALKLALVLALALGSTARSAQELYTDVEYPIIGDEGYAELSYGMFMVGGYALDCAYGDHPYSLMITAERLTIGSPHVYVPQSIQFYPHLYRPDVQAARASTCENVSAYLGYAATVSPPLPPGYWRVDVTWARTFGVQQTVSKIVEVSQQ